MTAQAITPPATATTGRSAQLALRAALIREAVKLWPLLDPKRIDQTFPGWVAAMMALAARYHQQSAHLAAVLYRRARSEALQSPTPTDLIRLADTPDPEWMRRAFGFSGPGMLEKDTARPGTALSTTLGTASRIVLDGGRTTMRDTVNADPAAVGWYRVTDGQPCAFCALVASRGIVYKSAETAGRTANSRFTGHGMFKFHNDCGCTAEPAFSRHQPLPALSQRAADIYDQHAAGRSNQLAAFRKAWNDHQARTA